MMKSSKSKQILKIERTRKNAYFNPFLTLGLMLASIIIFFIILGFFWLPRSYEMSLQLKFCTPNLTHPFGCDDMGRDIF